MLDSIDKLSQTYGTTVISSASKQGNKRAKLSKVDKMDAAIFQMINPNKEKYRQYATTVIVSLNIFVVLFAVLTKDCTLAMMVPAVWFLSPW